MLDKKPSTSIPLIFQKLKEYESGDSRFTKLKIWLMHTGMNFNNSSFSRRVVEDNLHTLANTPVLAFIEEDEAGELDYSDHRIILHRSEDGKVDLKYLGKAIGVIPQDNNAKWETRIADDGRELEYLTVEALLWNKWDDSVNIIKRKGSTGQSMELSDDYEGYWDDNGVFHFEKFRFFGACLLGDSTLPAMQKSTAELQFSQNNDLQKDIENKMQEFYTLFSKGGDTKMTEETKVTNEEVEFEEDEVAVDENDEQVEDAVEDSQDVVNQEENNDNFENSIETSSEASESSTEDESETNEESHSNDEEDATDDSEQSDEDSVNYEVEYGKLSLIHEELKCDFESMKTQLIELKEFKRQREEGDLKSKFEGKLSDEDFEQVFIEMKESSLELVEEKLFALIGKKNFSIQKQVKNNSVENKIQISQQNKKDTYNPYGSIFED